jgi:hypothetical protein
LSRDSERLNSCQIDHLRASTGEVKRPRQRPNAFFVKLRLRTILETAEAELARRNLPRSLWRGFRIAYLHGSAFFIPSAAMKEVLGEEPDQACNSPTPESTTHADRSPYDFARLAAIASALQTETKRDRLICLATALGEIEEKLARIIYGSVRFKGRQALVAKKKSASPLTSLVTALGQELRARDTKPSHQNVISELRKAEKSVVLKALRRHKDPLVRRTQVLGLSADRRGVRISLPSGEERMFNMTSVMNILSKQPN